MDEREEIGICYKEDLYTELVYIDKEEKDSVLKIIMDETIDVFKIADKEIKKSELDSLMFEGMTIQFYEQEELWWAYKHCYYKDATAGCYYVN